MGTNQIIQNDCKIGKKKYMMISPDRKLVTSRHFSIILSPAASESQIISIFSKDLPGQPKRVEVGLGGVPELFRSPSLDAGIQGTAEKARKRKRG